MIYTFLITCFGLHNKHSFFFFVLIVFQIKFIPLGNFIQDKFVEFLLFRKQYTRYYPLTSRIFLSIRTDKIIIRQGKWPILVGNRNTAVQERVFWGSSLSPWVLKGEIKEGIALIDRMKINMVYQGYRYW